MNISVLFSVSIKCARHHLSFRGLTAREPSYNIEALEWDLLTMLLVSIEWDIFIVFLVSRVGYI